MGPILHEFAPAVRGSRDAGSRNLRPAIFTIPVDCLILEIAQEPMILIWPVISLTSRGSGKPSRWDNFNGAQHLK